MKKRRIWVSAFGALVLVAGALIGAPTASAATTFSQTYPITYDNMNPCTGEEIVGSGSATVTVDESLATDGSMHYHSSTRINGLHAVALITNKKYVVQDTLFDEFNFVGADEETFNLTAHYIRQGEDGTFVLGDDFYQYIKSHITANDAGVITSFDVDMNTMFCQ
jgi:hypothetical protein